MEIPKFSFTNTDESEKPLQFTYRLDSTGLRKTTTTSNDCGNLVEVPFSSLNNSSYTSKQRVFIGEDSLTNAYHILVLEEDEK